MSFEIHFIDLLMYANNCNEFNLLCKDNVLCFSNQHTKIAHRSSTWLIIYIHNTKFLSKLKTIPYLCSCGGDWKTICENGYTEPWYNATGGISHNSWRLWIHSGKNTYKTAALFISWHFIKFCFFLYLINVFTRIPNHISVFIQSMRNKVDDQF